VYWVQNPLNQMNKSSLARPYFDSGSDIDVQFAALRDRVETVLDTSLPAPDTTPGTLHEAMRYATLGGGKRFRALLVYASGSVVSADQDALDCAACAVELVHAYSLIHDDLPCMDDDSLRRGKPTCHIKFGEATAILAGDALQALAFDVIASRDSSTSDSARLRQITALASASGSEGMAGGQMLDLLATNRTPGLDALRTLHSLKTGLLIRASVRMGALCNDNVSKADLEALDRYATAIGLAFQVIDDILDEESDTDTLGKTSGADRDKGKATYPAMLGLEPSRQVAMDLYQQAIASLEPLGDNTGLLEGLAEKIVTRIS
jgi:farnesyl diphosphate synthase